MVYAGFWRRFGAHMIDYCIQVIIACIVMVFVGFAIGMAVGIQKAKDKHAVTSMLQHVAPFSYISPAHAEEPTAGAVTPMPPTTSSIPSTSSLTPVAPDNAIVVPQPGTHGAEPDPMPSDAAESLDAPIDGAPGNSGPSYDEGTHDNRVSPLTPSHSDEDEELIDKTTTNIITAVAYAFAFLLGIVYHTCFIAGSWQATPGKRAMGCIVVNRDGSRLSYLQAFCRHIACAISGLTLMIGYMLAGWTKESTALHDMICGTRVVRTQVTSEIMKA